LISYLSRTIIYRIFKLLAVEDATRTSIFFITWRNIWAMHSNRYLGDTVRFVLNALCTKTGVNMLTLNVSEK
ncbi:hypothetical protein H5410_021976, partial [Solanum commersonii]